MDAERISWPASRLSDTGTAFRLESLRGARRCAARNPRVRAQRAAGAETAKPNAIRSDQQQCIYRRRWRLLLWQQGGGAVQTATEVTNWKQRSSFRMTLSGHVSG